MRLQGPALLVAALAFSVLAIASLIDAAGTHSPTPVTLTVLWPEPPETTEAPTPAPPAPINLTVEWPGLPAPQAPAQPQPQPDEGFQLLALSHDEQTGASTLVVQRRVENPFEPGEHRWTLTFYTFNPTTKERERLTYLGSRTIEYDMGPDEMGFRSKKGWAPRDFRRAIEAARQDD